LQKSPSTGTPFPDPLASGGEAPRPPMASWQLEVPPPDSRQTPTSFRNPG